MLIDFEALPNFQISVSNELFLTARNKLTLKVKIDEPASSISSLSFSFTLTS